MPRIILIRHGEAGKSPSDPDPELTKLGHEQAQRLANTLTTSLIAPAGFNLISSPKTRAMQTALPLSELWRSEITIEPAVVEIPSPEGMPLTSRGNWIQDLLAARWDVLTPAQVAWREQTMSYLHRCTENTLIFCHFMVINSVVAAIRGDDRIVQFHPDYASQTELQLEGGNLTLVQLGRERTGNQNVIR